MSKVKEKSLKFFNTFVPEGTDVFTMFEWGWRHPVIKGSDGTVIFEQDVFAPVHWSDQAVQIVASKYFYGDASKGKKVTEGGREYSIWELVCRVADTISNWGLRDGYFDEENETIFRNELRYILINQMASFNSPVWFNVGLYEKYGITETGDKTLWGQDLDHYYPDTEIGREHAVRPVDPYRNGQASACFIISVEDSIDDIWQLMSESARLFKYGSGVGADWSNLRSTKEKISGGGVPSGPVSFMKVQDATGGTIKSGGKTRRAAIMQTLKVTHPDIMEFIEVKQNEERKAWSLINEGYDGSFNGDAYGSVAFQNVNQSVRLTDQFMNDLENDEYTWQYDVNGNPIQKTLASSIMYKIAEGTYVCGDPGVQYEDTIQDWHTCKVSGPINSSNPCSEYMFLDNSACNLASINLLKFLNDDGIFQTENLRFVSKLLITAMDILVDRSGYPSEEIAKNSRDFRPLGLGFTNLGATLMTLGIPYDSAKGRGVAGALMAIIHGSAYEQSGVLADHLEPFVKYSENADSFDGVMTKHKEAIRNLEGREEIGPLYGAAYDALERARLNVERYGARNAQVTVLAPTGTISFMMDCDTTGIEPELGLVKYKLLAGKGDSMMKIVNKSVEPALRRLGYDEETIELAVGYIEDQGTIEGGYIEREHFPVFATSFGTFNTISPNAHIDMMAACQPFISGAISKTVNLPEDCTIEDIQNTYVRGWEKGLKAVAIYRENSKRSQPLNLKETKDEPEDTRGDIWTTSGDGYTNEVPTISPLETKPVRTKLPDNRESITHKFSIDGHEGYFTVGLYPETRKPGELFITMSKQGSTISGLMDVFAKSISLNLQYGVPLEDLITKFSYTRFEPSGFTNNKKVQTCTSIIDYIFRCLGTMDFTPHDTVTFGGGEGSYNIVPKKEEPLEGKSYEYTFDEMVGGTTVDLSKVKSRRDGFDVIRETTVTSDAPPCPTCGTITQRAGSCYTCPACGNSTGCG